MPNFKEQLQERVEKAISDEVFPGCVVGIVTPDDEELIISSGFFTYEKEQAVEKDSIYDISSITKSVSTHSVLLHLVDIGKIKLTDKVTDFVPEFNSSPEKEKVLIKHLLTYTLDLNLPPKEALYEELNKTSFKTMMGKMLQSPLVEKPGRNYYYRKITALLIALISQRVIGDPVDKSSKELFISPLGMERTTFYPEKFPLEEIVPTEIEAGGEIVHGIVHDEGTRLLQQQGIYLGAAGLFSTAPDLLIFLSMILEKGQLGGKRYFSESIIDKSLSPQFSGGGYTAGLGWELAAKRYLGDRATENTFGRTGFTGCLLAGDRKRNAGFVVLSNHIYPTRRENSDEINEVRHDIADIVWQYVDNLKS